MQETPVKLVGWDWEALHSLGLIPFCWAHKFCTVNCAKTALVDAHGLSQVTGTENACLQVLVSILLFCLLCQDSSDLSAT